MKPLSEEVKSEIRRLAGEMIAITSRLSTLRRMLADTDPARGHESERQKNALLAA